MEEFVTITTVYDHINEDIVARDILIRQQCKAKLPDAIIAATAIVYSLNLISRNTKDFKDIDGLNIIDPHTL